MSSTTTTAARKPPAGVASNPNRRSFIQANSAARAASTTPPPQSTSPGPGHVRRHTLLDSSTRSRGSSIAGARGVVGKRSGLSEQQEAENAAMLEELRNEAKELRARLERSEGSAMEYQRQMEALQFRLDETSNEQAKIEDAFHQKQKEFEQLDEKMRKLNLAIRDRENAFEAEVSFFFRSRLVFSPCLGGLFRLMLLPLKQTTFMTLRFPLCEESFADRCSCFRGQNSKRMRKRQSCT